MASLPPATTDDCSTSMEPAVYADEAATQREVMMLGLLDNIQACPSEGLVTIRAAKIIELFLRSNPSGVWALQRDRGKKKHAQRPKGIIQLLRKALDVSGSTAQKLWDVLSPTLIALAKAPKPEEAFDTFGSDFDVQTSLITFEPPFPNCIQCKRDLAMPAEQARHIHYFTADGVEQARYVYGTCASCRIDYHNTYYHVKDSDTIIHYDIKHSVDTNFLVSTHEMINLRVSDIFNGLVRDFWLPFKSLASWYGDTIGSKTRASSVATTDRMSDTCILTLFVIHALFRHRERIGQRGPLVVPGYAGPRNPKDKWQARYRALAEEQTRALRTTGLPHAHHICDICVRQPTSTHAPRVIRISDGITLGRPSCRFTYCDRPLEKQTHWFCHEHRKEAKVCAVPGCRAPNEFSSHPDKWRTCRLSEHRKQEIVKREQRTLSSADWAKKRKGTTLLGVRGKRGRTTPLVDSSGPTLHPGGDEAESASESEVDSEDSERSVLDSEGARDQDVVSDGSSGGASDNENDNWSESEQPAVGGVAATARRRKADKGKVKKALLSQARSHNEQTIVGPCLMILARRTFYFSEGPHRVLDFWKEEIDPRLRPWLTMVFDDACHIVKIINSRAKSDPSPGIWDRTYFVVDKFHKRTKHKRGDKVCDRYCDPDLCPWLDKVNTSAAESVNSHLAMGFKFLRKYRATFYDFLLDECITLYNDKVAAGLERRGQNPRNLPSSGDLKV